MPLLPHYHGYLDRFEGAHRTWPALSEDVALEDYGILQLRSTVDRRYVHEPEWILACDQLAALLWDRYKNTGQVALLDECIDLRRAIYTVYMDMPDLWSKKRRAGVPDHLSVCTLFVSSLKEHFQLHRDESIREEMIGPMEEILSQSQELGDTGRADACSELASLLLQQYRRSANTAFLDKATRLQREALTTTSADTRPYRCGALAVSLKMRFEKTGDFDLLNEAISLDREALISRLDRHPDRAVLCSNLAVSLKMCFEHTRNVSDLEEALKLDREALTLVEFTHPGRVFLCVNLAVSLAMCFLSTQEETLLNEAIEICREAVCQLPDGHCDRPKMHATLADILFMLAEQTASPDLVEECIRLYQTALDILPSNHPHRQYALKGLIKAHLNPKFPQYDVDSALNYVQQSLSSNGNNLPTLLSDVAYFMRLIRVPPGQLNQQRRLLECLSAAIDLSSVIAGFVLDPQSQLRYLAACQDFGARAYDAARRLGDISVGLELLERARGMMWAQMLHRRNPQLQDAPRAFRLKLMDLFADITIPITDNQPVLSLTYDHVRAIERDVRHQHNAEIQRLIRQIRSIAGYEGFMGGLSFEALAQVAIDHPVIVLVATEDGCSALIVQSTLQPLVALPLGDAKPGELAMISMDAVTTTFRGDSGEETDEDQYHSVTRSGTDNRSSANRLMGTREPTSSSKHYRTLKRLWETVVKPIIDFLGIKKSEGKARPRIHWCPTGPFMFMPLHAAGTYDKGEQDYCSDYVVSSYTPTLTALLHAQKSAPSLHLKESKMVLVSAQQPNNRTIPTLINVEEEARQVAAASEQAGVSVNKDCTPNATVADVTDALKTANFAHIACHGTQNTHNPLLSGFYLSDRLLTVNQLMRLAPKNAFFAFLSACETAKGDKNQPDQTVHLAAAMLFVGFRSVVATMWAMNDSDGPRVAKLFYERLFAEDMIKIDAIPYALDYAVREMRKGGVPPERWATFVHIGA